MSSTDQKTDPVDTTQGAVMRRVDQVIDDLQRGRVTSDRQIGELEHGVGKAKADSGVRRAMRL